MDRLTRCVEYVRAQTDFVPSVAVVLGSGLGDFAARMQVQTEFAYSDLPDFPVSTVSGHRGRLLLGTVRAVPVAVLQGRVHFYEGYTAAETVMPVRLSYQLGARNLLLTNAAGALNTEYAPGDFMLLEDHIASLMPSPLAGPNLDALGPRFPDMTQVYDAELRRRIRTVARRMQIRLREGVYMQVPGPAYETPAEVRLYRAFGADAVGMSTATEAVAAAHMGMRICAVSFITNMAAGIAETRLSHEEVQRCAAESGPTFFRLLEEVVAHAF